MGIFLQIIIFCWVILLLYWVISARKVKQDVGRDGTPWRYGGIAVAVVAALIFSQPVFQARLFPFNVALGIIGDVLCVGGIFYAIWARYHLGKNWSSMPAMKKDHELVTSGPYGTVRHPIYTGILFAVLGSVLLSGSGWLLIFFIMLAVFIRRINVEEGYMMQLFPDQYPEYKKRTKALIPFVW